MPRQSPAIHFIMRNHATHWRDIDGLDESDIESQPRRFVGGRNSWVAQSFVRLRSALEDRGWRVSAGGNYIPGAICIAHRDDANDFRGEAHASFLVVVRADRAPVVACDLALAQNGLELRAYERFVPLWPQPGLRPRNSQRRGMRTVAYLGRTGAAPRWFGDEAFHRALRSRGMAFEVKRDWGDYGEVDLALASRDEASAVLATKPATKLYNAWLGQVPMLAAPEPAYAEVRRSPLDFIEIQDGDDVLRAIDVLRASPGLYEAMVANGRLRGRDFGVEATRARWLAFLEDDALPAFRRTDLGWGRRAWHWRAMMAQKALSRLHRMRVLLERCALGRGTARRAAYSGERAAHYFAHVSGQTVGAAD